MSVDDYDIFTYYRNLWKAVSEKCNAIHQGIISTDGFTVNCKKLRIGAKDKTTTAKDNAIAEAYGKKSSFPLTLKCSTFRHAITKQDSETDFVMKLHLTITTELSISCMTEFSGINKFQ